MEDSFFAEGFLEHPMPITRREPSKHAAPNADRCPLFRSVISSSDLLGIGDERSHDILWDIEHFVIRGGDKKEALTAFAEHVSR